MHSRERTPNEIWVEIFRYLPRQSLTRVHSFHVPPLPSRHPRFWSSDEIAPMVRQCTVVPLECYEASQDREPWRVSCLGSTADALSCEFLNQISKFTGLLKLSVTEVELDWDALFDMCTLPLLNDLNGAFALAQIPLPRVVSSRKLVDPTPRYRETISAVSCFPNVHTFTTTVDLSTVSKSVAAFSKFPAVRILQLEKLRYSSHLERTSYPNTSQILPILDTYIGSHELLPLFLEKPTLKNLDAVPRNCVSCSAHRLRISPLCTRPSTPLLWKPFAPLSRKTMWHERIYPEPAEFFSALADSPLPQSLQRLAITLKWGKEDFTLHPDGSPISVEGRANLRERCLALTKLWLDGHDFLYSWRRASEDGELGQEKSAFQEGHVKCMRCGFKAFWQG
ncbi:hypothetical protein FB45DRAFT_1069813 [Roridomyces roridus]|uniref:Uncharacterized protein n=1 Tax=Roridomyces roridus TaxID=1738132 RepID=A0AAD7F8E9_9AGAR|nr:hypothetical protein FB45DRAFT_1069813 [Roridomyces roridus]